jgi:hypothetical protein
MNSKWNLLRLDGGTLMAAVWRLRFHGPDHCFAVTDVGVL